MLLAITFTTRTISTVNFKMGRVEVYYALKYIITIRIIIIYQHSYNGIWSG